MSGVEFDQVYLSFLKKILNNSSDENSENDCNNYDSNAGV